VCSQLFQSKSSTNISIKEEKRNLAQLELFTKMFNCKTKCSFFSCTKPDIPQATLQTTLQPTTTTTTTMMTTTSVHRNENMIGKHMMMRSFSVVSQTCVLLEARLLETFWLENCFSSQKSNKMPAQWWLCSADDGKSSTAFCGIFTSMLTEGE
jgi:hypothetical protein